MLQDRVFRQHSILPTQITAMDRLAFVGHQGMGGLSFSPASEFSPEQRQDIDLATLGLEAQSVFDQSLSEELDVHTQQVLATVVAVGSSGGARPKAQIFMPS